MGVRIGVSDEEWSMIAPLLPAEHGRVCRPAHDNRGYFEGMLWIARTGAQWRELPCEYGKWNSVYQRFRRWALAGVWDRMLETLAERTQPGRRLDQPDRVILQAHQAATGVLQGIKTRRRWGVHPPVSQSPSGIS